MVSDKDGAKVYEQGPNADVKNLNFFFNDPFIINCPNCKFMKFFRNIKIISF